MYLLNLILLIMSASSAERSSVAIGTNHNMASGTVVARSGKIAYVLTNKHVINATDKRIWVLYQRQRFTAQFVKSHPTADLALASVEINAPAVVLASQEATVGDTVTNWGRFTGPSHGKVVGATRFSDNNGLVVDSDYFSVAGDSGGGVFNKSGYLVAVHYARRGDPEGEAETVALAVRLEHIQYLLKEFRK